MALFKGYNANDGGEEPAKELEGKIADEPEPEEEHESPLRKLCLSSLWNRKFGLTECSDLGFCCDDRHHKPEHIGILIDDLLEIERYEPGPIFHGYLYDGIYTGRGYMCVYDVLGECPYPKGCCMATHMPSDVEKQDLETLIAANKKCVDAYEFHAIMSGWEEDEQEEDEQEEEQEESLEPESPEIDRQSEIDRWSIIVSGY
jgi:hypothetical protein